jgi:hypothetical protein
MLIRVKYVAPTGLCFEDHFITQGVALCYEMPALQAWNTKSGNCYRH